MNENRDEEGLQSVQRIYLLAICTIYEVSHVVCQFQDLPRTRRQIDLFQEVHLPNESPRPLVSTGPIP